MSEISRFFGIIIKMFYDDHNPPHFHAEYSGSEAVFDLHGNVVEGKLSSVAATKLVRKWARMHRAELERDWRLMRIHQEPFKIKPLS